MTGEQHRGEAERLMEPDSEYPELALVHALLYVGDQVGALQAKKMPHGMPG